MTASIIEEKSALIGLSRGVFIAAHVASSLPGIPTLLGFAPLTQLSYAKEFQEKNLQENALAKALSLTHLIPYLCNRTIRLYIGNLDERVGTRHCFNWVEGLCAAALEKGIRSPKIELMIRPSIGHQGHGTSKETFYDGALWLKNQLGAVL